MDDLAARAMVFALQVHALQRRKYTNLPYSTHLAEVAGMVAAVACKPVFEQWREPMIACSWLHDTMEDMGVTRSQLVSAFGEVVATGVVLLSNVEVGNRAARKAAARQRLAGAPAWVQSIKAADVASNTCNIRQVDPAFAVTYLGEQRLMLEVLTEADPTLLEIAWAHVGR